MVALAAPDDVAHALGLVNASAFTAAQSVRVDGLLARVSREFRREAERQFTPGTYTVRLITVGGQVHLAETVDGVGDVTSATMLDCNGDAVALTYTLDGQTLTLEYSGRRLPSGVLVTVVYDGVADVPDDVVSAVAAIVGRHLTVDPNTAKAVELSAGPFRERRAEWASSTCLLTADECEQARSYRHPTPSIIIQTP